jgi:hypothetical protein
MHISKTAFVSCISVLFVALAVHVTVVNSGEARPSALSPAQSMVADGGAPVPDPWLLADGGAPVPDPWLLADGGAPVPDPWRNVSA